VKYFFYILHSQINNKYYTGHTSNLQERIKKNNTNHGGYTGCVYDWKLIYFEEYTSKEKAYARERQIKKWKNADRIIVLISNGSEHDGIELR
jgi:putative endonuclease